MGKSDAAKAADEVWAMAKELERRLAAHIGEIQQQRLEKYAAHRERRANQTWEWGRAYHERLQVEREERRQCRTDSAFRGLQIPPPGISRRFGNPQPNRK